MNENPYAELEQKYANNINQQNELLNQSEQIQNQQIDANNKFALDNIERQRGYAQKDFEKEARGAYQDYQKLINPYGVQAENLFSSGLGNSGYSETSKLNAYNTYQNRYATAKTSMDRLSEDFNNQMNQAILEANQEKAQVALLKLQTQMDNLWNQMNFDSSLTQNKVGYNQWLDSFNYQKEQDAIANQLAREQFEYQKQQDAISRASSSSNDYYTQMLIDYLNSLESEETEQESNVLYGTNKVDTRDSVLYQGPTDPINIKDALEYNMKSYQKSVEEAQKQQDALNKKNAEKIIGDLWNRY